MQNIKVIEFLPEDTTASELKDVYEIGNKLGIRFRADTLVDLIENATDDNDEYIGDYELKNVVPKDNISFEEGCAVIAKSGCIIVIEDINSNKFGTLCTIYPFNGKYSRFKCQFSLYDGILNRQNYDLYEVYVKEDKRGAGTMLKYRRNNNEGLPRIEQESLDSYYLENKEKIQNDARVCSGMLGTLMPQDKLRGWEESLITIQSVESDFPDYYIGGKLFESTSMCKAIKKLFLLIKRSLLTDDYLSADNISGAFNIKISEDVDNSDKAIVEVYWGHSYVIKLRVDLSDYDLNYEIDYSLCSDKWEWKSRDLKSTFRDVLSELKEVGVPINAIDIYSYNENACIKEYKSLGVYIGIKKGVTNERVLMDYPDENNVYSIGVLV